MWRTDEMSCRLSRTPVPTRRTHACPHNAAHMPVPHASISFHTFSNLSAPPVMRLPPSRDSARAVMAPS